MLSKVFSNKVLPLLFAIMIIAGISFYSCHKMRIFDRMTTKSGSYNDDEMPLRYYNEPIRRKRTQYFEEPIEEGFEEGFEEGYDESFEEGFEDGVEGMTKGAIANPSDLLPKDVNSQWASLNPITKGNVAIPDLLQSGYHIGLDSVGQTLKNANYQNRADPVIERVNTGPWQQSSIEPDYTRREL